MNIKSAKFVYYLPSISVWFIFQILLWQASLIWVSFLVLIFINFLNLKFLPGINQFNLSRFLMASVAGIFSVSSLAYLSLLPNRSSGQFLIFLVALILYQYWRLVYKKLSPKPITQKLWQIFKIRTREFVFIGVSLYINFLAIFLLSASLFALKYFLSLAYWPIFLILFVFIFLLSFAAASACDLLNSLDNKYFWSLVALLIWQLSIVLFFLPLNYSVIGLILAILYYSAINIGRFSLVGKLSQHRLRWYALFPALAIILLLISSAWSF